MRENKSVLEIADMYTQAFREDAGKLNIRWPDIVSKATDNIDMYIKIISKLLEDGYAYQNGGNVYFDTSKLDDYYRLTNHKIDNMVVGVREGVEEDCNKRNQADFVLWFTKSKFQDQELKWDSSWGLGYPGWHIECSGIAIKYLGEYLDIHCGGVDNIFPHHTNEIAQSEAYLGHEWCNFWVHGEHLNDKAGKMSKSRGEFLTVSLLEKKGYNPLSYRYLCLNSYYHNALTFSYEILDGASREYNKLRNKSLNLSNEGEIDEDNFNLYVNKFKECLSNDLNTSMCITVLYDVLKDKELNDKTKRVLIKSFDEVLSLDLLKNEDNSIDSELEKYIKEMIDKRNEYKNNKEYDKADDIREELKEKGVIIKDTREGTIFEIVG
jgi:cysteinyl-tRNA synthetase